jgi:hypothetical protein
MTAKPPFRPWGELEWTLGLSAPRHWRFMGCVSSVERSICALTSLHLLAQSGRAQVESVEMLRIVDTVPENPERERGLIHDRISSCNQEGLTINPIDVDLEAPLQNQEWKQRLDFHEQTSLCLDISSLPKRFFFRIIKAALLSSNVRDFVILYSKPKEYPVGPLASNCRDWSTITGFGCEDPEQQELAAKQLIVGAGFAVSGLHDYLEGHNEISVEVLIPFPAAPWKTVRRSWESARAIEEALGSDSETGHTNIHPNYHEVGALDTSSTFEKLLSLTQRGKRAATLAPLGPKPHSVAMCLLAAQSDHFPVYYAQPQTYAVDYSLGCETTYAYWIKHSGVNFYSV